MYVKGIGPCTNTLVKTLCVGFANFPGSKRQIACLVTLPPARLRGRFSRFFQAASDLRSSLAAVYIPTSGYERRFMRLLRERTNETE